MVRLVFDDPEGGARTLNARVGPGFDVVEFTQGKGVNPYRLQAIQAGRNAPVAVNMVSLHGFPVQHFPAHTPGSLPSRWVVESAVDAGWAGIGIVERGGRPVLLTEDFDEVREYRGKRCFDQAVQAQAQYVELERRLGAVNDTDRDLMLEDGAGVFYDLGHAVAVREVARFQGADPEQCWDPQEMRAIQNLELRREVSQWVSDEALYWDLGSSLVRERVTGWIVSRLHESGRRCSTCDPGWSHDIGDAVKALGLDR